MKHSSDTTKGIKTRRVCRLFCLERIVHSQLSFLPSIDIGSRQNNRAQSSFVFSCTAYDQSRLLSLIQKKWGKKSTQDISFGAGFAASNFINVISKQSFWQISIQKEFNSLDCTWQ